MMKVYTQFQEIRGGSAKREFKKLFARLSENIISKLWSALSCM